MTGLTPFTTGFSDTIPLRFYTSNIGIGYSALSNNPAATAIANTALGYNSLKSATASNNTSVGYQALQNLTGGGGGTAVGDSAGASATNGDFVTCIGYHADVPAAYTTNCTVIGASAVGTRSNSVVLGRAGLDDVIIGATCVMHVYTVATLPAAATAGAGARALVSDALAPAFGAAVAGGGAVTIPVFSTGTAWNVG